MMDELAIRRIIDRLRDRGHDVSVRASYTARFDRVERQAAPTMNAYITLRSITTDNHKNAVSYRSGHTKTVRWRSNT